MPWISDANRPVYLQLIEEVKRRIMTGEYSAGSKLPSVRDLALEAAVNPNTMQRALSELEREQLIYAERTSGRFVTEDLNMISLLKTEFASEIIKRFITSLEELGFTTDEILNAVSTAVK